MAAKKKARSTTGKRLPAGRYRGFYLRLDRTARTKSGKRLPQGYLVLAVDDPSASGWIAVIVAGKLDYIRRADVVRVRSGDANGSRASVA
jgi:hypothetical protein